MINHLPSGYTRVEVLSNSDVHDSKIPVTVYSLFVLSRDTTELWNFSHPPFLTGRSRLTPVLGNTIR